MVRDTLNAARNESRYQVLMMEIRDLMRHEKKKSKEKRESENCSTAKLRKNSVLSVKDILCESVSATKKLLCNFKLEKLHQSSRFGKPSRADNSGNGMKKLLYGKMTNKH